MRSQPVKSNQPKKAVPIITDLRTPKPGVSVRTVMYVEVGHLGSDQVAQLAAQFAQTYSGPVHGPHYFVPVRNGRLRTDVQFEQEFLETVRQVCEVREDGLIHLKGDACQVQVSRITVDATQE